MMFLAIRGDFKWSIHPDFEQVHESLIDNQGSAVSVPDKFLCHVPKVYTYPLSTHL